MIGFACKTIWSTVVIWKFLNYSFNFSDCDYCFHILFLFLVQSWKVVSFYEFFHSIFSILLAYRCLYYSLMIVWISVVSVVTSLFLFLRVRLKVYQFYLSLQRTSFCFHWSFLLFSLFLFLLFLLWPLVSSTNFGFCLFFL